MKTYRSVCPFDCPDSCGLLVDVVDGYAVALRGDPNHPRTRGLLCPKMLHYERTVHSPNRLTTPLLRIGKKGGGSFRAISWEEAIRLICSRFKEIGSEYGGEAILPYSYAGTMGLVQRNSGHPFFHKLAASRLERTICSPAKDAGWKAVMGDTPAVDPSCMEHSDFIILWGINAVATSIHTMLDVNAARLRGARVIAIDTYRTPTCDAAHEAYLVKPGGDAALALGMMHVIHRDRLFDAQFIADNVSGFDEFAATILPSCSPQKMADSCGIPANVIETLAHEYAAAKAPFIRVGSGLTRYGNGAMTVRTINILPALTGALRNPAGSVFCGTSTGAAFPLEATVLREDFMHQPTRLVSMNQLGDALTTLENPPVKALYVYHSNPATIAPDQNAVIKGLSRDDLFTIVHERFMTDTARYADILLPATSSLEHPDLYRSYGSYYCQRCSAVVHPPGEARSNWDTFAALAVGMGWDEPFFRQSAEDLIKQLLAEPNIWRDAERTELLRSGEPVALTPPSAPDGAWFTPSGKIEIFNHIEQHPFPVLLPTHAEGDGYPLKMQPAVTPYALNSSFYEQNALQLKQDCMKLLMNPADGEQRGLNHGDQVVAYNSHGEVSFILELTDKVPCGTVVTEGVWWSSLIGGKRGVNALTSQRLTDGGRGSTLYDVTVEVRKAL